MLETRVKKYASYRKNKGWVKEETKTEKVIVEEKTEDLKASKSTIPFSYDDVLKGINASSEEENDEKEKKPVNKGLIFFIVFVSLLLIALIILIILLIRR